ncbi:MAG: metallophosphoesterase [Steroidobacteraceae bacterium]|nr:metallophosphoesterase [Steroidobacteraceae bacterium]
MDSLPAFDVTLRAPAKPAADAITVPVKSPLFVIADTHGEFAILAQMLQRHRVVDATLRWSYGRGHLVVLGDVFDRGPHHTEILWLLYKLEAEAAKAGGGVHLLLGNHETMVMMGDLRYLNRKYVDTARVLGVNYHELFDARSVLGQWLRSRPTVLRINRQLFLHAGISRALVERKLTLADINGTIRQTLEGSLTEPERERANFLMTTEGPLWYRGFFVEQRDFTTATSADVDLALEHFGVDRIFIGHTIVPTVTPLFDGRVIALNVYPKREGESVSFEALRVRGGAIQRATFEGGAEEILPR